MLLAMTSLDKDNNQRHFDRQKIPGYEIIILEDLEVEEEHFRSEHDDVQAHYPDESQYSTIQSTK